MERPEGPTLFAQLRNALAAVDRPDWMRFYRERSMLLSERGEVMTTPKSSEEFTRFDDAIGKLLKASKTDVEKKMEREKKTREKRRKAG
jgi:hypothetical protein